MKKSLLKKIYYILIRTARICGTTYSLSASHLSLMTQALKGRYYQENGVSFPFSSQSRDIGEQLWGRGRIPLSILWFFQLAKSNQYKKIDKRKSDLILCAWEHHIPERFRDRKRIKVYQIFWARDEVVNLGGIKGSLQSTKTQLFKSLLCRVGRSKRDCFW